MVQQSGRLLKDICEILPEMLEFMSSDSTNTFVGLGMCNSMKIVVHYLMLMMKGWKVVFSFSVYTMGTLATALRFISPTSSATNYCKNAQTGYHPPTQNAFNHHVVHPHYKACIGDHRRMLKLPYQSLIAMVGKPAVTNRPSTGWINSLHLKHYCSACHVTSKLIIACTGVACDARLVCHAPMPLGSLRVKTLQTQTKMNH